MTVAHAHPPQGELPVTTTGAARRFVLATPRRSGGDGIGYVGTLLQRALTRIGGKEPLLAELRSEPGRVPMSERMRVAARLASLQLQGAVDLVVYNHVSLARSQAVLPAGMRRPYAIFLHGIEVWDAALDRRKLAALRGASLLISNSAFTAARIARLHETIGPVTPCPLALIDESGEEGAVDLALINRVGPHAALIVGRMSASERYKGHDELLEAWPRVLRAVPDAQLVIAGGGDDVERLRAKVRSIGIAEHVLFAGRVSDATRDALLRRASVFTMPSRGEGFGLVYLEAMRAGLVCVGSKADAAGDVIADGVTGLLVEPDDREALAAAVTRLLVDRTVAKQMGAAGRTRFEREFTFDSFCGRLGRALERAAGPRELR